MKKNYLFILLMFAASTAWSQIPNPGFENWTGSEPDNWSTNNISSFSSYPITQTATAHGGTKALKGEVDSAATIGVQSPYLSCDGTGGTGFPISQAYTMLDFWYQTNLLPGDAFIASVVMNDAGSPIGGGSQELFASAGTYTHLVVPISYGPGTPNTCQISFLIIDTTGATSGHVGSYFIIDDLNLSGSTGIVSAPGLNELHVYPNPAHGKLYINCGVTAGEQPVLSLEDMSGRVIIQKSTQSKLNNSISENIDVADVPPGIYLLSLQTETHRMIKRIVIQ